MHCSSNTAGNWYSSAVWLGAQHRPVVALTTQFTVILPHPVYTYVSPISRLAGEEAQIWGASKPGKNMEPNKCSHLTTEAPTFPPASPRVQNGDHSPCSHLLHQGHGLALSRCAHQSPLLSDFWRVYAALCPAMAQHQFITVTHNLCPTCAVARWEGLSNCLW